MAATSDRARRAAAAALLALVMAACGVGEVSSAAPFYRSSMHGSSAVAVTSVAEGVGMAEAVLLGRVVRTAAGEESIPVLDPDSGEVVSNTPAPPGVVATVEVDEVLAGALDEEHAQGVAGFAQGRTLEDLAAEARAAGR